MAWSVIARRSTLFITIMSLVALPGSGGNSVAGTMGFMFHKEICPLGPGFFGLNLVAIPFESPYANAQDVCEALNLTLLAGRVTQYDAASGTPYSFLCGDLNPFSLNPHVGVIVTNPTPTSGILVGAHADPPLPGVLIHARGFPQKGTNVFPVPYNSMASNAEDLCMDASLTPLPQFNVVRVKACQGIALQHRCTGLGAFDLELGEAVVLLNPTTTTFMPSHF